MTTIASKEIMIIKRMIKLKKLKIAKINYRNYHNKFKIQIVY